MSGKQGVWLWNIFYWNHLYLKSSGGICNFCTFRYCKFVSFHRQFICLYDTSVSLRIFLRPLSAYFKTFNKIDPKSLSWQMEVHSTKLLRVTYFLSQNAKIDSTFLEPCSVYSIISRKFHSFERSTTTGIPEVI